MLGQQRGFSLDLETRQRYSMGWPTDCARQHTSHHDAWHVPDSTCRVPVGQQGQSQHCRLGAPTHGLTGSKHEIGKRMRVARTRYQGAMSVARMSHSIFRQCTLSQLGLVTSPPVSACMRMAKLRGRNGGGVIRAGRCEQREHDHRHLGGEAHRVGVPRPPAQAHAHVQGPMLSTGRSRGGAEQRTRAPHQMTFFISLCRPS